MCRANIVFDICSIDCCCAYMCQLYCPQLFPKFLLCQIAHPTRASIVLHQDCPILLLSSLLLLLFLLLLLSTLSYHWVVQHSNFAAIQLGSSVDHCYDKIFLKKLQLGLDSYLKLLQLVLTKWYVCNNLDKGHANAVHIDEGLLRESNIHKLDFN